MAFVNNLPRFVPPGCLLHQSFGIQCRPVSSRGHVVRACVEPISVERRAFIASLSLLALTRAEPASADRTGKFSTKLTAKRRYLPRITSGMEALRQLGEEIMLSGQSDNWMPAVSTFVTGKAQDMKTALALFSTSYFSEGNKIGPVERRLKEVEDVLNQSILDLGVAAKQNSVGPAVAAYDRAVTAANDYLTVAKLTDAVPPLALLDSK